jgi:hypothetical protein
MGTAMSTELKVTTDGPAVLMTLTKPGTSTTITFQPDAAEEIADLLRLAARYARRNR